MGQKLYNMYPAIVGSRSGEPVMVRLTGRTPYFFFQLSVRDPTAEQKRPRAAVFYCRSSTMSTCVPIRVQPNIRSASSGTSRTQPCESGRPGRSPP